MIFGGTLVLCERLLLLTVIAPCFNISKPNGLDMLDYVQKVCFGFKRFKWSPRASCCELQPTLDLQKFGVRLDFRTFLNN